MDQCTLVYIEVKVYKKAQVKTSLYSKTIEVSGLFKGFQLLTDTIVSALVIAWAALVSLAVVCLHRLPVGRLVGDPERITQSNRML